MPIITRLFPHLIQPQYPVRVDQGNPLTKGLQDVAVLGNTLRWNAARNTFLSSNGTVNSDPRGPIITTDATAYSVPGGYAVPPITVVVGFIRLGAPTSGNHALWISKDDTTGNSGLYFRYEDAGTLTVLKSQTANIGSGSFTVKPGGSLLGVTIDSGNFALYGDGDLVASGTHGQTFTSVTPVIGSESSEALEDHPNGVFYFYAAWNRVLTAAEFKALSLNPWQIFEDRKQNIYVSAASGVSAALTGQSITVAAGNLTAAITAPITGQSVPLGQGTVTVDPGGVSAALTGQSVGVALGSLTPIVSVALTGQAIPLSLGTMVPAFERAITGQGVTAALGSMVGAVAPALTGQSLTVEQGNIAVLAASNDATGGYYIRLPYDYRRKKKAYESTEAAPKEARAPKAKRKLETYPSDINKLSPYIPALFDVLAQRQAAQAEYRRMYNIRARAALLAA